MFLVSLTFPGLLLLLALLMQRVEQPLRDQTMGDRVQEALGHGQVDVEQLVTAHAATPVERHWRRQQRMARLRSARLSVRD